MAPVERSLKPVSSVWACGPRVVPRFAVGEIASGDTGRGEPTSRARWEA